MFELIQTLISSRDQLAFTCKTLECHRENDRELIAWNFVGKTYKVLFCFKIRCIGAYLVIFNIASF